MIRRCRNKSKAVELFMALGLIAIVGACGAATTDQANPQSSAKMNSISQGGEGGEGHEDHSSHANASKQTDSDVNYMVSLGLIKGHMIVAKELIDLGKAKEAEPHIGHPVEELYPDIEGDLSTRKVKEFKGILNELQALVKSQPSNPKVVKLYEQAIQSIDTAILALPVNKRESSSFILQAINEILKVANEEYAAAIANNKFVERLEYQDSRGFLLYSTELYQSISKQLDKTQPEVSKTLQDKLKVLATSWTTVDLPQAPILSPTEVSTLVEEISVVSKQ